MRRQPALLTPQEEEQKHKFWHGVFLAVLALGFAAIVYTWDRANPEIVNNIITNG